MRGVRTVQTAEFQELALEKDEILSMWAQIMLEWGHYRSAEGLRFPTQLETENVRVRPCSELSCG